MCWAVLKFIKNCGFESSKTFMYKNLQSPRILAFIMLKTLIASISYLKRGGCLQSQIFVTPKSNGYAQWFFNSKNLAMPRMYSSS